MASRLNPAIRNSLIAAAGSLRIAPGPGQRADLPDLPRAPEPEAPEPEPEPAATPSAAKLAAQAAGTVLKWGMEGLRQSDPWVIERRLAACAACEYRAPAPDTLVYRGAKVLAGKDSEICTICHCLLNTKAAISTEHCPEKDPDDPALSRWGEPWVTPRTGWPWR
jgi:hypothetical protein